MPNEIRPCTLPAHWKRIEPFDACDVIQIRNEETRVVIDLDYVKFVNGHPIFGKAINSPFYDEDLISSQRYLQEAITTIANALNAPVLAKKEVLKYLPQGSNFIAHKVGYSPIWQSAFYCLESQQWWSQDEPLDVSYIIKSDECFETLARLLQFTLDGVRIKEGG